MTLRYNDIFDNRPHTIGAVITTNHPASRYGQPVVVLEDGGALDYQSWVLLDYQIQEIKKEEEPLMKQWLEAINNMI